MQVRSKQERKRERMKEESRKKGEMIAEITSMHQHCFDTMKGLEDLRTLGTQGAVSGLVKSGEEKEGEALPEGRCVHASL